MAAAPAPRSRPNGRLTLAELRFLAAEFDALSGEQLWPAADFVEFVCDELAAAPGWSQQVEPTDAHAGGHRV